MVLIVSDLDLSFKVISISPLFFVVLMYVQKATILICIYYGLIFESLFIEINFKGLFFFYFNFRLTRTIPTENNFNMKKSYCLLSSFTDDDQIRRFFNTKIFLNIVELLIQFQYCWFLSIRAKPCYWNHFHSWWLWKECSWRYGIVCGALSEICNCTQKFLFKYNVTPLVRMKRQPQNYVLVIQTHCDDNIVKDNILHLFTSLSNRNFL